MPDRSALQEQGAKVPEVRLLQANSTKGMKGKIYG